MNHDVVRCDAAGEEVGVHEDSCDGGGVCFRRVGDEDCPDGEQLAEFERTLAVGEIELDLQRRGSQSSVVSMELRWEDTNRDCGCVVFDYQVMPACSFRLLLASAVDGA